SNGAATKSAEISLHRFAICSAQRPRTIPRTCRDPISISVLQSNGRCARLVCERCASSTQEGARPATFPPFSATAAIAELPVDTWLLSARAGREKPPRFFDSAQGGSDHAEYIRLLSGAITCVFGSRSSPSR